MPDDPRSTRPPHLAQAWDELRKFSDLRPVTSTPPPTTDIVVSPFAWLLAACLAFNPYRD